MKSRIITITNQKGGTGKTSTSLFLAYGLAERGYKVLVIDLDQQADTTFSMTHNKSYDHSKTSFEVVTRQITAAQAVIPINLLVDLIPANKKLAQLDVALFQNGIYKADLLQQALKPLKENYDFILIDTPPALGMATTNALTASDFVIIPTQADIYSIKGLADLADTIRQIPNKKLKVAGILIGRYDSRTVYSKAVAKTLSEGAKTLNTKIFDAKIREAISVKESMHNFKSIFEYDKKGKVSKDINNFIDELLGEI